MATLRHGSSHIRTTAEVLTGSCHATLSEMWEGARIHFNMVLHDGFWSERTREKHLPRHYFFIFLMYIHLDPAKDVCSAILAQLVFLE